MGLFCPIILILFGSVDRVWNQFAMRYTITSQFVGDDSPRLTAVTPRFRHSVMKPRMELLHLVKQFPSEFGHRSVVQTNPLQ